jgi:ParB/RepB/Spo0J family partition protein
LDEELLEIDVDRLKPSPFQVRVLDQSDVALLELKDSIRKGGVIEPPVVRQTSDGWEIVAGHRRVLCCQLLGIRKIKCIQRSLTDEQVCEAILDENLKRQSFNPIDEAKAYRNLKKFAWTEEKIAARYNVSRDIVAQRLRLLTFQQPIQDLVAKGQLGVSHAEAIATAPATKQLGLSRTVMEKGLTVRETTEASKQLVEQERTNKIALENIGSIVAGFDNRIRNLESTTAMHQMSVNLFNFHSHAYAWKADACRHNQNGLCHRFYWNSEPPDWVRALVQFKKLEDGEWRLQPCSPVCSHCDLYEPRPTSENH